MTFMQFSIRMLFGLCITTVIVGYGLTRVPWRAHIVVPRQFEAHVREFLSDHGVACSQRGFYQWNEIGFHSAPAWELPESTIFQDAAENHYYCRIEYTPTLSAFRWERSVGDAGMCGLTRGNDDR